ncbi:IS701 family transposase [Streptomyces collinus]|uniref:IS701 family transposase n=1 Tax=Streptomyces collinus TaxID=42684 RepID=UPI0036AA74D5
MKTIKDQVAVGATIARQAWTTAFGAAMDTITDCFPRPEPRLVAREMTGAMLMELEARNCWTLAEALGHPGPHRLQHFLSRSGFDHDTARDRLAAWTAGELVDDNAVLIVDETGDAKSSADCVGAARQYSGALGGVGLCQVAVHLTYAGERGHAIIDRALYLPTAWAEDEERRLLTHVPDEVEFATKSQLAAAMLERVRSLNIMARWLAGDEVYGGRDLRRQARRLGFDYALAVRADHRATTGAGSFTATQLADRIPKKAWARMRTGHGLKGDRHYDWALVEVQADDTPDGHEDGHAYLVIRRHRYTGERSFYRCYSTTPVTLATLIDVITRRWKVEEDFQLAKGVCGLDEGQTTCWNSWMRWTLISMLVAAVLAITRARTTSPASPARLVVASARDSSACCGPPCCPDPTAIWRTCCTGPPGAVTTSIRQPRPIADGTTSPSPQPLDQQRCPTDQELQLPWKTWESSCHAPPMTTRTLPMSSKPAPLAYNCW